MSNIKRNTFSVQYITGRLADEIVLQFINPAAGWLPDTLRATVPGVTTPVRQAAVTLFGCTNLAMAAKAANLLAAAQAYRRRIVTWETDLEGLVANRGDVVTLSHDLTQWGYSGRLVSGSTTVLVLDRTVPFTPATYHYVGVRFPNGSYNIYDVTYQAGESATITLATPLPSAPDADPNHPPLDYLWFFAPQPTPGKKVKITSVKPLAGNAVRITATDEDPAYYAAENNSYTYVPPPTYNGDTPTIGNLTVSDTLITVGSGFATRLAVAWDVTGTSGSARLRAAYEDPLRSGFGAFEDLGTTDRRSFEFQGPVSGRVQVEVTLFGFFDRTGPGGTATTTYTILGKDRKPAAVASLNVAQNGNTITADWDEVPDVDVVIYNLRYGKPGAVFEAMLPLTTAEAGTSFTTTKLPPGTWRVGIKPEDSSGNLSVNAAYDDITVSNTQDVIVAAPQAPDWVSPALQLPSSGGYVNIAAPVAGLSVSQVTVEIRMTVNALFDWNNYVVNNWGADNGWLLFADAAGQALFGVYGPSSAQNNAIAVPGTLKAGLAYHLVGTYDGITVRIYVNGPERGTLPLSSHVLLTSGALQVGQNGAATISEMRIYNRALSAAEVASRAAFVDIRSGLVVQHDYREGSGTSIADGSGNGNTGTISGSGVIWINDTQPRGFIRHPTGVLIPDSTKLASAHTKAELFEQYVPYPVAVSAYEAPPIDIGFDDDARVWDESAAALGRGQSGELDFHTELDYRQAVGAYDGFETWSIGQRNARHFKHRLVMANTAGQVGVLQTFTPVVDQIEFEQSGSGVMGASGTTIVFPLPFHNVPYIEVDAAGGSALIPAHDQETTTGFRAFLYTLAGAVATGQTFKWKARGV